MQKDKKRLDKTSFDNVFSQNDIKFMSRALGLARMAEKCGDVPVGAVLVRDGNVIGEAYNTREAMKNALGHAEIGTIEQGCGSIGDWRLDGCTLYVTLEPCPMCAGAIVNSRISRVVFGAKDSISGAMGSIWAIHRNPFERSGVEVAGGCLADESRELLREFFKRRRQ